MSNSFLCFTSAALRRAAFIFLFCVLGIQLAPAGVLPYDDKPQYLPGPRPSDADIQRWKDRKFGMFIHFGLYSAYGGLVDGKKIDNGYSEQIMANAPVPLAEYAATARTFNPTSFDPDAIVALAKEAGMKFIVITAKHHDGFNMFHTAQTSYNVVDATPYGKDVVKEMSDACARAGMKFGVYYSSIDWHYPGASAYIEGNSNPIPPAHADFNVAQLKELATNYGQLSEIWFDMGKPTAEQSDRFSRTIHDLQPQTMVSGRVFNYQGDFTVMGDNEVPQFVIDEPWQTPASIFPATWGYRSWQQRDDLPGKIRENILRLVEVVSRGGNYILNIGPEGDGSIVPYESNVLRGVGEWMAIHSDAIYASNAQPFRSLDFGYATVKPDKLYIFLRRVPEDGVLHLPGLRNKDLHVSVMGDPEHASFPSVFSAQGQTIDTKPMKAALERVIRVHGESAAFLPVLVVSHERPLKITQPAILPNAHGRIRLTAAAADHFMNYNGQGYEAPSTLYKLRWFADMKPGKYRVQLSYHFADAMAATSTAAQINVTIGNQNLPITIVNKSIQGEKASATQKPTIESTVSIKGRASTTRIQVTPLQPFYKGTALPVEIDQVALIPEL